MRMQGLARDLVTGSALNESAVIGQGWFELLASASRQILAIKSDPRLNGLERLVGVRAGGQSRAAIEALLSVNDRLGEPLHLLLDDFAGASLVAGWAWSRWPDGRDPSLKQGEARPLPRMEGICAGFRPGASSLTEDGRPRQDIQSSAYVSPLTHPDDPEGWHSSEFQEGAGMRRARWIDVWPEADGIRIEAGFQDSATDPSGTRVAIHEYLVSAKADARGARLVALSADPRVLPYRECPAAAGNIDRLIGRPLISFRSAVLAELPGTLGCTHLNDVLRALADVPQLWLMLESHTRRRH
ncbi:DUF2889 domain-containing protein [Hyphomonas sp. CACIAM 19H1]|uniref:DUF2889 domain-containing protein n=1 Tax=Hyphomonas sp. CACIAM 19H1 TaxID=1873716 RepID=UPI0013B05655|nr:DUF2889 domain-containing protein [Hyphomonas sp. CACIAM 19H1]